LSGERVERRLAAILAADVAGYSRLMGENEAGTLARLRTHRRELIDPKVAEHKGRIVKTTGDGILIEFPSVVEAVACAVAVQRGMTERNISIPEEQRIVFRVGVNLGDIVVEDGDIHGDGVNVAARLEALAEPGGICVSGTVRDHIGDRLDVVFDDLGEQALKNIARPVRVYGVRFANVSRTPNVSPAESQTTLALPDKPSLAVLPFQNMSGDPEQEYFADGMVEEITTAISRFPWLFVIARNSAFAYKGKVVDVRQVGRELGVRYVLEGSVRKAGTRVRITGQLIDTATGAHLWADRFDGSLDDIFELQDEVASRVVGVIEPRLRLAETDRASRKPTENLDAYDLHLRSLAQTYKRTEEGTAESIRLARRALELDPAFAPAMARIAGSRQTQKTQHWIPESGVEVEEGIQMARQALAVARDDSEVMWRAAIALVVLAGENQTALTAIDRAIELNPNSALAYAVRGIVLAYLNRPDEAIAAAERAIRLSPNDPIIFNSYQALCLAHLIAGRYEEALSWADRALAANARLPSLCQKLSLLGHLGRRDEAGECLQRLREAYPEPTVIAVMRAFTKGMSPELAAHIAKGLRKAGLPEE
jgi:TolB-like protein/class 3 adenylate cyclase